MNLWKSHQKLCKVNVPYVFKCLKSPTKPHAVDTASVKCALSESKYETSHARVARQSNLNISQTKDYNDPCTSSKSNAPTRMKAASGWENWDNWTITLT